MRLASRTAFSIAAVGVILFALGLAGVADPGIPHEMDAGDPGRSPLIAVGALLAFFGLLIGYTTHLLSRD